MRASVHYHAANSCILAMGQIDGRALVTVEGLKGEQLHPVQEAMAENGSSQCGFCTPGIVISLAGLAAGKAGANDDDIHDALAGNLCRCTGYRPIVEAATQGDSRRRREDRRAAGGRLCKDRTRTQRFRLSGSTFHQPASLNDLLQLRKERPDAILLGGGTDLGVALADYHSDWDEVISLAHVRELRAIREPENHLSFGAAVTWEEDARERVIELSTRLSRRLSAVSVRPRYAPWEPSAVISARRARSATVRRR